MLKKFQIINKIINRLGFKNFQEYQNSEIYQNMFYDICKNSGPMCSMCHNQKATIIFFTLVNENTISGLNNSQLCVLCNKCNNILNNVDKTLRTPKKKKYWR